MKQRGCGHQKNLKVCGDNQLRREVDVVIQQLNPHSTVIYSNRLSLAVSQTPGDGGLSLKQPTGS